MGLIDIHTHILPAIDDGAKTVEDSIALLRQEKENGYRQRGHPKKF